MFVIDIQMLSNKLDEYNNVLDMITVTIIKGNHLVKLEKKEIQKLISIKIKIPFFVYQHTEM